MKKRPVTPEAADGLKRSGTLLKFKHFASKFTRWMLLFVPHSLSLSIGWLVGFRPKPRVEFWEQKYTVEFVCWGFLLYLKECFEVNFKIIWSKHFLRRETWVVSKTRVGMGFWKWGGWKLRKQILSLTRINLALIDFKQTVKIYKTIRALQSQQHWSCGDAATAARSKYIVISCFWTHVLCFTCAVEFELSNVGWAWLSDCFGRLSPNLCCLFWALLIEMCFTAVHLQRKRDLTWSLLHWQKMPVFFSLLRQLTDLCSPLYYRVPKDFEEPSDSPRRNYQMFSTLNRYGKKFGEMWTSFPLFVGSRFPQNCFCDAKKANNDFSLKIWQTALVTTGQQGSVKTGWWRKKLIRFIWPLLMIIRSKNRCCWPVVTRAVCQIFRLKPLFAFLASQKQFCGNLDPTNNGFVSSFFFRS